MPTKFQNPVFTTAKPILIRTFIPALGPDGKKGLVRVDTTFTNQLLNRAMDDPAIAQFIVRDILTCYAIKLQEIGGEPV